jgi:hypothetical protein
VIQGLKSKLTKIAYRIAFNHFLDETIKSKDLRTLLNTKQNVVESKIIDHITYLKDVGGLTYRSILVHLSAIFHFGQLQIDPFVKNPEHITNLPSIFEIPSKDLTRELNKSFYNVDYPQLKKIGSALDIHYEFTI